MGAAAALLLAGVGLCSVTARAGSSSTTLQVSATVVATCIVMAADLNFGDYTGREVRVVGKIAARCNGQSAYHIALDAGSHYDGAYRAVSNSMQRIPYTLYTPDGREWGDNDYAATYRWGSSVGGIGMGDWISLPLLGVLWGGVTGIPTGLYQDVVTVTVYF